MCPEAFSPKGAVQNDFLVLIVVISSVSQLLSTLLIEQQQDTAAQDVGTVIGDV